jgi:hypothetical protein
MAPSLSQPWAEVPRRLSRLLSLIVAGERRRVRHARAGRIPEPAGWPRKVGDALDTIDVRLRGSSGSLSRIPAGDMAAVIDLTTARPASAFHITPSRQRALWS